MQLPIEEKDIRAHITEANVSIEDAYERGKTDINFFAGLAMPEVFLFSLPKFYVTVWSILTMRKDVDMGRLLRFCLGLPRGHAKTTFIKILIAWMIVYDRVSFVLVVCANSELADALVADIHDILCSPNMTAVYGDWEAGLAIDSADQKKAMYHNRPVVIVARGWAAGIRGLNLKNMRPDLIFCDDVQTRKNSESPTDSQKLLSELTGSIFKSIAPRGDRLIIYVGNMYSTDCILEKFRKNTRWISMITGAILHDGVPLWPELFSLEELMESYDHDEQLGESATWFAEVMNDPQGTAQSLLPHPIPDCPVASIKDPDGVFITIDPAGFRKNSDDNVIAVHYVHDSRYFVMATVKGILNPKELIQTTLQLALAHGASLIGVESVGYQQTLGFWLSHFMGELNITGITVVELQPHGRSKEARIRLFVQELYSKSYYLLDPTTRRDFNWQASLYKLGQKDNKDDLLDAIAYGTDVRKEFSHLVSNLRRMPVTLDGECSVVDDNTPF